MKDFIILGLVIVIALLAVGRSTGPQAMIEPVGAHVTRSDFPVCVFVRPPPLFRAPTPAGYRPDVPFSDRGVS